MTLSPPRRSLVPPPVRNPQQRYLHQTSPIQPDQDTLRKCKNYYRKKVWTVCTTDVEWIACEHIVKTEPMVQVEKEIEDLEKRIQTASETKKMTILKQVKDMHIRLINMCKTRRFKLLPQKYSVVVTMSPNNMATTKIKFGCSMTQFPINVNDGTTGHKLQGGKIILSSRLGQAVVSFEIGSTQSYHELERWMEFFFSVRLTWRNHSNRQKNSRRISNTRKNKRKLIWIKEKRKWRPSRRKSR